MTASLLTPALRQGSRRKWHFASMRNTTRPLSLRLRDRQSRRLERISARVRPITILVEAAAPSVYRSTHEANFAALAAAMAEVAMAKAASNSSKGTKATRKVLKRPGHPVHASPAGSLAIRPRTAKQTMQRVPPPLSEIRSRQEKGRPSDARHSTIGPSFA
jgi:hypothetical protein